MKSRVEMKDNEDADTKTVELNETNPLQAGKGRLPPRLPSPPSCYSDQSPLTFKARRRRQENWPSIFPREFLA